ncbi:DUF2637 domain-containing protein [Amycolatopsis balhimycina]|uniref:DUF2637 domain-containing protein n=1 Tax=Amycolatopsis balhimycina TaxID=208443 RepID=UPI00036D7C6F|nr:DUF2637 domain-containing protein [Amycolatopsis balhimycina]
MRRLKEWFAQDLALSVQCACTGLVAFGAAYASYRVGREFALRFGADAVTASIWPLLVDGLLTIAAVESPAGVVAAVGVDEFQGRHVVAGQEGPFDRACVAFVGDARRQLLAQILREADFEAQLVGDLGVPRVERDGQLVGRGLRAAEVVARRLGGHLTQDVEDLLQHRQPVPHIRYSRPFRVRSDAEGTAVPLLARVRLDVQQPQHADGDAEQHNHYPRARVVRCMSVS